ncbi:PAS domain-containing sensor histidine kinase [Rufibacter soli]
MKSESEVLPIIPLGSQPLDNYRLLVENVTDYAIFMLDPTGHVSTWNLGAKKIKQYEPQEIIGKHFSIFYTSEAKDREFPAYELREAQAQGRFEDEGWRVRKDGSVFWANVIITPLYNEEKTLLGFSKITRDLSERKKAEDDLFKAYEWLKESEERYRLLVEGVTDYAIFMLDPAGNVATWNQGAQKIKGYEAKEVIGKYFSRFYGQDAIRQGRPEHELKEAKDHGRFEDESWRIRKDGSAFWASVVITAIYNSKNELLGFSKITRDLTDKKQLEEKLFRTHVELKESEEKTRLLIDSVKDYAIIMLNPEGLVVTWNSGAERIKGYKQQEIVGKHFSAFYGREAIEQNFPQFELSKAIENGRFEDEGWRIRKDGTAFWANVVLSPIYNEENRLLGFAKITRDLTERRRNEDLMKKNMELVRINNDLDNFVYTASHDLKTPITNLEGLLIALVEDLGPDKEKHEHILSMMRGSIKTFKNVISDLAEITQLQQEAHTSEKVYLTEMLADVNEHLKGLINASKARIELKTDGFEFLQYSRKNLRSLLFNLISNAIKYAHPDRAPEVCIKTELAENGAHILSVSDNGLGISPKQTTKIFDMYKRAHDHVEGTGIGLYLVKKILDNSGDRIEVNSKEGEGTVFRLVFK